MNKIEFVLGVTVFLLSVFSILFINSGVVPSDEYPGHYTYGFPACLSELLLITISLEGIVATAHAAHRKKFLELGLGIVIIVWGFLASGWVDLSIYDGCSPYIKGSLTNELIQMSLSIIPGLFLGIALTLDGMLRKTLPFGKRTNPSL